MNYQSFSLKNGTVFVVDIGHVTLSETFFSNLRKIIESLRERISYSCLRNNNSEEICILFVRTINYPECTKKISLIYNFIFMELANANMVKKVDNLLTNPNFENLILQSTDGFATVSLKELFFKCNKLLNFFKAYKNKLIILITQNSDYFENIDEQTFQNLRIDLNDMKKNKTHMNIIIFGENPIKNTSSWNKLDVKLDLCCNLNDLLQILNEKCCVTKCHNNISLYLTKNININVDLYNIVEVKENPKGFHIDAVTNQLIKCEQIFKFNEDDEVFNDYKNFLTHDEYVNENNIMKMNFYNETLDFTEEEIYNFRKISSLGIQILGFRKMEKFNLNYIYSTTKFLSVNENNFKHKRIFYSLYNSCIMKNVFAVGRYVLQTNYVPQLIALIPPKNLRKECFKHEGFYLVKMPFKENIRKIHEIEANYLINPQIETRLFIDKLTSNFNLLHYDDPMLGRHYQGVEALALEQKSTEMKEPHNCLQPYFISRNFINEDR